MKQFELNDKIKIFGLYMGARYEYKENGKRLHDIVRFDIGTQTRILSHDARLTLKPLSTLTDAEVIEVCYQYFPVPFSGRNGKRFWNIVREENEILVGSSYNDYSFTFDVTDASIQNYKGGEQDAFWSNVQMLDYLRDHGFAIPYKGIDLFKSGIAVKPKP